MSRPRVLVADDSATIQKVFELAFENENVEVVIANNGATAFEMALAIKPSMIIADVNMPQMDGFELCSAIKNDSKTALIPVYLLSSALDDFDEEKSNTVRADGRFEKPFKSDEIVNKVKDVIETSTAAFLMEAPDDEEETEVEIEDESNTFDEIDISLDTLMESLTEVDEEKDDLLPVIEEPEEEVEETVPAEDVPPAPSVIELKPENIIDADDFDDDDIELESFLSYEELSGEEDEVAPEINVAEININFVDGDKAHNDHENQSVDSIADDIINEASESLEEDGKLVDADDIDAEEPPPTEMPDVEAADFDEKVEPDIDLGEKELSDRAISELEPIDEPKIDDQEEKPEADPEETPSAMDDQLGQGISTAFETLRTIGLHDVVEGAIKETAGGKITEDDIKKTIEMAVKSAIDEIKPQIIETFRSVATEVTLNVAEDLVKQTIEQIKSETED
ncbi:hypothetical protein MNBD_NITROSPINAE01-1158 [hydrothermal vent metagenome]|uniref:Response regulatory domain-containing protein n=1 Tax=hydrothermal vent metagenome TaxID=652676 RepID=A0A3B1BZF1_9ZZZZ